MGCNRDIASDYLQSALDPKEMVKSVGRITGFLSRRRDVFDGIAVRGVSGMVIGSAVAYKMRLPLLIVRKKDGNHSTMKVEGDESIKRYVIIDDFIGTGATVEEIVKKIEEFNGAKPIGTTLYSAWGTINRYEKRVADKHKFWIKYVTPFSRELYNPKF